jgi:hypothetical protein
VVFCAGQHTGAIPCRASRSTEQDGAMHGALRIDLARRQQGLMMCSVMKLLAPCLVALLQALVALGTTPGPVLSPTANSMHWTLQVCCWKLSSVLCVYVMLITYLNMGERHCARLEKPCGALQIDVPTNCPTSEVPVANATALIACAVPCNTTGGQFMSHTQGSDCIAGQGSRYYLPVFQCGTLTSCGISTLQALAPCTVGEPLLQAAPPTMSGKGMTSKSLSKPSQVS